mgnify:CR=1 FL=1
MTDSNEAERFFSRKILLAGSEYMELTQDLERPPWADAKGVQTL